MSEWTHSSDTQKPRAIPIQLLLQRRQPLRSFLPWLKVENLMQQWILLQVCLKSFCQETPHGIQLDCSNQSIHCKSIAMAELDLGRGNSAILLQDTLSHFVSCFKHALLMLGLQVGHALPMLCFGIMLTLCYFVLHRIRAHSSAHG